MEEVLFMRDEMANLAWAIERVTESPLERRSTAMKQTWSANGVAPRGTSSACVSQRPAALSSGH